MTSCPARAGIVASLLLAAAGPACCDEPAIVADRPGFGESASAVGRGRLQVETGFDWTRLDADTSSLDLPEPLLRFGLGGDVELRVGGPDWVVIHSPGTRTAGWTDASVGVKGHLSVRGHDVSLRATAYLPTGGTGFSSGRLDPELALAWSHGLPGSWSLGATVSQRWQREIGQAFTSPSLSLGRSLGANAATFVEYAAIVSPDSAPVHRFDHGYTWNPGPRTQLDVSFGIALSRVPTTFFVGAGFCQRF
jgi:hypothetical protein